MGRSSAAYVPSIDITYQSLGDGKVAAGCQVHPVNERLRGAVADVLIDGKEREGRRIGDISNGRVEHGQICA